MGSRRSSLEMNVEILENSKKRIRPTILMASVNMAWRPFMKRIHELKSSGLIEEIDLSDEEIKRDKRTKINYYITPKGLSIVEAMHAVKKVIE